MRRNQVLALVLAFAVSFVVVGVPYWQIPYAKVALPNSIVGFGLFVVLLAAAIVRYVYRVPLAASVTVIGLAAPTAVLLRVIVEATADSTSHNLWPLEVVLTGLVSFAASFSGALLAAALSLLLKRSDAE